MKTLIKLLVAAVVINAAARGGMTAWSYYHFQDETEQLIRFGFDEPVEELHDRIAQRAMELRIPIRSDAIEVRREGPRTVATAAYTQPVELFPRYVYPLALSFEVEAFSVR
jgi:hypothetical protein